MRFNIGAKLGIGFGVVLVLMSGFGVYVNNTSSATAQSIRDLKDIGESSRRVREISDSIAKTRIAMRDFLLNPSNENKSVLVEVSSSTNKSINDALESITSTEHESLLTSLRDDYSAYSSAVAELGSLLEQSLRIQRESLNVAGGETSSRLDKAGSNLSAQDAMLVASAKSATFEARLFANRYLNDSTPENLKLAEAAVSKLDDELQNAASRASDASVRTLLEQASTTAKQYATAFTQILAVATERNQLRTTKLDPAAKRMDATSDRMMESLSKIALEAEVATEQRASQAVFVGWIVLGVSLVLGITAALWLSRLITGSLRPVAARAKEIAANDLTGSPLSVRSNDELGDLTTSMNTMSESLRRMIAELTNSAQEVAAASTQIAASSEEISAGLNQQQSQVTQISSAAEEMSAAAADIARKAADANTEADAAGNAAESGASTVEGTVAGMRRIADAVNATGTSVHELGKRGEQIGQIINVISDIADQTNLLALNAAIEAARAGEHGRGFAVVADEVRKLAERTVKATEEVSSSIKAIQDETTQAVSRMQACTGEVDSGVNAANEAGQSLREIVSKAQAVGAGIRSIAAAAEEQSAATEQVTRSVESIVSMSQQAAAGASQAAGAASQLSLKAEGLREMVARFKIDAAGKFPSKSR
jgi:methyl-accepting chemotaxis protein